LNVNLVNEQDNEESALTIAGKKRKLKRQDFIQLGTSYDLNETQIRNAFGNILDREKSCRISLKGVF
jgi:serine/threonine-protein kinase HipA